jgi:histidinol-phosphate aminotransferase
MPKCGRYSRCWSLSFLASCFQSITEKIISTREYFVSQLKNLGWRVLPSKANFVFSERKGITGKEIYLELKPKGIFVGHFDVEGITKFVRITIGKREGMKRFFKVLKKAL